MKALVYCGLPGSGKSTLAREVSGTTVIETDDFWYVDGEYRYQVERAGESHRWNIKRWVDLCRAGFPNIACANTNIALQEIAPYVAIADAYGYEVGVVRVEVSLKTSKARNIHAVPEMTLEYMDREFNRVMYPEWWNVTTIDNEPPCESYETCRHGDNLSGL